MEISMIVGIAALAYVLIIIIIVMLLRHRRAKSKDGVEAVNKDVAQSVVAAPGDNVHDLSISAGAPNERELEDDEYGSVRRPKLFYNAVRLDAHEKAHNPAWSTDEYNELKHLKNRVGRHERLIY